MVGAVAAGTISTASAIAQQYAQMQGVGSATSAGSGSDNDGEAGAVGATGGDRAQISGPGQLLGQLQQLQAQNPTKFKQILTDIAHQLTAVAQQATGSQGQFLTDLASNLQSAANTGNLSALRPHHHTHQGQGVYNQQGQVTPASTLTTGSTTGDTTTGGTSLQQLLTNVATQISSAVGS